MYGNEARNPRMKESFIRIMKASTGDMK